CAIGGTALDIGAARSADRRRAATQQRAIASIRRYLGRRRVPAGARRAKRGCARHGPAEDARRARDAVGATLDGGTERDKSIRKDARSGRIELASGFERSRR